jgi:hypothetical protein
MFATRSIPFHGFMDINGSHLGGRIDTPDLGPWEPWLPISITNRTLGYQFFTHMHPYVRELVKRLIEKSVEGLEAADTEYVTNPDGTTGKLPNGKPRPVLYDDLFTNKSYDPGGVVQPPYPVKDLDFSSSGAYAVYNWELFFHVPLTIAIHLSKNQRFEEAQRWFHYIFDPTDDSTGDTPARFWKVRPFQITAIEMVADILVNLASGQDPTLQQDTINSIDVWKKKPFRPHLVARYRPSAYMFKTVMAYLDNLIDWGDSLFRQDTGEAINEATQIYVMAANILGPRPQMVPKRGSVRPQTYSSVRDDLDRFGNVLKELEADIPFDSGPHPAPASDLDPHAGLQTVGRALYFCVPRNDKLLGYWDTVADRLFKIRNSLNIQGIFRQLPLFEPPIDPALLARAAATGLDVAAILGGINQPLPLVRFQVLVQKAAEICQEVKSLGANLLAALEKEDNEALSLLRAGQERAILGMAEAIKYAQLQEATKAREGLEQSLQLATHRYTYYSRQLGINESDIKIPALEALNKDGLSNGNFKVGEPSVPMPDEPIDIAQDLNNEGGMILNTQEVAELEKLSDARAKHSEAATKEQVGAALALLPELGIDFYFWGIGGDVKFGGSALSRAMSFWASFARADADQFTYEAGNSAKIGSYSRREQDWAFQRNLAAGEITQLFKQIRAAQIREAAAELELKNHQQQIKNADTIQQFLSGETTQIGTQQYKKTSTQSFYTWMKREVKGLYAQCFQLAFDVARKAERALQHELGDSNATYLQFGYLAGKEGLLAGEKLYQDIKSMEMAYLDLNRREYELTRHVSLLQLNPLALLQLRATGRCTVLLPEEQYDFDGPGHYFRRIKSVAVSVPCVVGPYVGVNCTLTLLKSSIRKSPLLGDGYARTGADDPRFDDHFGSTAAIVTSTGQSDSGLFEVNLRDERYLPFEGAGAISEWQIELPADVRQFDYDTIADVILHVRYTAREAGDPLRGAAVANLKALLAAGGAAGSVRLFTVRHEFPTAWAAFKRAPKPGGANPRAGLTLDLKPEHYPFWSTGRLGNKALRVDLFGRSAQPSVLVADTPTDQPGPTQTDKLMKNDSLAGLRSGRLSAIALPAPTGSFTLYFDDNAMDDLWLALTWGNG